jgi:hypothetical protein
MQPVPTPLAPKIPAWQAARRRIERFAGGGRAPAPWLAGPVASKALNTMSLLFDGPRNPRRRWLAGLAAGAFVLVLAGPGARQAQAAPVDVPDPKAWAQLAPAEQARRRADLQQRLEQATPQERKQFRRQLRERLEALSPAERQALIGQTREQWRQLPPEERERLVQERRERLLSMPPTERRQLLQQRRLMLEKLSPEERAALREKLLER